jgi:putative chitinase
MPADALTNLRAVIDRLAPNATSGGLRWTLAFTNSMRSCGISTPRRAAAFLGQVMVETASLTQLTENLSYRPGRLCEVWPDRFPDLASAIPFANNGPRLANLIYAARMGNGPVESGDGWRFRGAGCLQLTGRATVTQCANAFYKAPNDMAAWLVTVEGASSSACWYWTQCKLNALADAWDVESITKRINGGLNGYADRLRFSLLALRLLEPPGIAAPAPTHAAAPPPQLTADQLMAQEQARLGIVDPTIPK